MSEWPEASHQCQWPKCSREVKEEWMWGCAEHFKMLPPDHATNIRATWKPGVDLKDQSRAYWRAISELTAWIIDHFDGFKDRHDPGRWTRLVRFVRERDESRSTRRAKEPDGQGESKF